MLIKKVGIIGAGPAGGYLACRLAQKGFEVLLFDDKAPWEKPCAGGLADLIWNRCPELVPLQKEGLPNRKVRIVTVKNRVFESELSRPLYTVSRKVLGRFLIDQACGAGARMVRAKVTGLEKTATGFVLKTSGGDSTLVDFVVGAEGFNSHVRKMFCPAWTGPDYGYTLSAIWPHETKSPLTFQFLPGLEGYSWIFPGRGATSLGIFSRGNRFQARQLSAMWERSLEANPEFAGFKPRLGEGAASWLIPALRFSTLRRQRVAGERWALVGDASGAAHSVSGAGIHLALETASALADYLIAGRPEQYQEWWRKFARAELLWPSLWGPFFYRGRMQRLLSDYLARSASARKIVIRLISGERPGRGEIFTSLLKMLAGA